MTISPQMRVFALVGALAAIGLALFFFIAGRSVDTDAANVTAVPHTSPARPAKSGAQTPTRPTQHAKARTTRFQTVRSGFPSAVDRAFRRHRVVVLVAYMPGSGVDAVVRKEARAAAIRTGAGYVPVNALNERVVGQLVARTGVLPDPSVLVIRRPGVVTATLGVTDRDTVAQAVVESKR
jgi:hypothetical protein